MFVFPCSDLMELPLPLPSPEALLLGLLPLSNLQGLGGTRCLLQSLLSPLTTYLLSVCPFSYLSLSFLLAMVWHY